MARKKKKEIVKQKFNTIGYTGTVKINVGTKKNLIGSTVIHNNGRIPLFQFLTKALKGDYGEADYIRPKFIKLYSLGAKGSAIPPGDFATWVQTLTPTSITTPLYSGEPIITEDSVNNTVSISFKFVIPFTQLSSLSNINLLALYCQQYKDNNQNASAYIVVTKVGDTSALGDLVEQVMGSISGINENEYNLFIEWELAFSNYTNQ